MCSFPTRRLVVCVSLSVGGCVGVRVLARYVSLFPRLRNVGRIIS